MGRNELRLHAQEAAARTGVIRIRAPRGHPAATAARASFVRTLPFDVVAGSCAVLDASAGLCATCASVFGSHIVVADRLGRESGGEDLWRVHEASVSAGVAVDVYVPSARSSSWMAARVEAIAYVPSLARALDRLACVSWVTPASNAFPAPAGSIAILRVHVPPGPARSFPSTVDVLGGGPISPPPEVGARVVLAGSPLALLAPWLLASGVAAGIVSALLCECKLPRPCDAHHPRAVLTDARAAGEAEGGLAFVEPRDGAPRAWAPYLVCAPLCWARERGDIAAAVDGEPAAAARLADRLGGALRPWLQGCGASAALPRERPLVPLAGLGTALLSAGLVPPPKPPRPAPRAPNAGDGPAGGAPVAAACARAAAAAVAVLCGRQWGTGARVRHPRLLVTCAHVVSAASDGAACRGALVSVPTVPVRVQERGGRTRRAVVLWCAGDGSAARRAGPSGAYTTPALDLALLLLPPDQDGAPAPPLAPSARVPALCEPVATCGYALFPPRAHVGPLATAGVVSKVVWHPFRGTPALLALSCPLYEGGSGGPVVAAGGAGGAGDLVGIASFTAGRHAAELAFAVPLLAESPADQLLAACARALELSPPPPPQAECGTAAHVLACPAWADARAAAAALSRLSSDPALGTLMAMREPLAALQPAARL